MFCTLLLLSFGLLGHVFAFDPSFYPNKMSLDSNYQVFWKVDEKAQTIQFGVQVGTTGWIGLGIGESTSGSMPGGDLAVISYAGNKPVITDHYALEFDYPSVDTCQDWVLVSHQQLDGSTQVEISRSLDTGDTQDRKISAGKQRLLFAYGTDNQLSLVYHDARRGSWELVLWSDGTEPQPPSDPNIQTAEFFIQNYQIPRSKTNYACIAHHIPLDRLQPDHHIVQLDLILDPRNIGVTHHQLVHTCSNTGPLSMVARFFEQPHDCLSPIGNPFSGCHSLLYAWAMGVDKTVVPEEAGFRMGYSRDAFEYFVIEMHYDNPKGTPGLVDNSGLRMHYTNRLRKYDASTITLGDPYISFFPIPAGQERVLRESTCPAQCTNKFDRDIHVFGSFMHMHSLGRQMWTTHYRGNEFLGITNRADFYAFDFQQQTDMNFTIKRGDRLNTHCVFNSKDRATATNFGYDSSAEMCMDFLTYYPRQKFRGNDFAYCGYFGWFVAPMTLCGSNQAFMTLGSIMPVKNPQQPDGMDFIDVEFGKEPSTCLFTPYYQNVLAAGSAFFGASFSFFLYATCCLRIARKRLLSKQPEQL